MEDNELEIPKHKITIQELKESNLVINRRLILVDSSLYTDEAFEYLRELIDANESIAFIYDRRKVYTQGKYFGDVWEDSLMFFGDYTILNEEGEIVAQLKAELEKENLNITQKNHIMISAEEYFKDGDKFKTLILGFDVPGLVNDSIVVASDKSEYNLVVENDQIKLNQYIPITLEASQPPLLEYDSLIENIEINLNVNGNNGIKNVSVTSIPEQTIEISNDLDLFISTVTKNINTKFIINYNDAQTYKSLELEQKYGFGLFYGTEPILRENYKDCQRIISLDSCNCEFTLTQGNMEYGFFACPENFKPIFKDMESSIIGGWEFYIRTVLYSNNIYYNVYKTEQCGLGTNRWLVYQI